MDGFENRLIALGEHYLEKNFQKNDITKMLDKYRRLVLEIEVGDEKIARLCQVLTNLGCVTCESCEGHGKEIPRIWFFPPESKQALVLLSQILQKASYVKNFPWQIVVDGNVNAAQQLSYRLEPSYEKMQIELPRDYERLMLDLDVIAVSILAYMGD